MAGSRQARAGRPSPEKVRFRSSRGPRGPGTRRWSRFVSSFSPSIERTSERACRPSISWIDHSRLLVGYSRRSAPWCGPKTHGNPMLSAQRGGRSPTDKQKIPDGVRSRTDKEIVERLSVAESSTDKEIRESISVGDEGRELGPRRCSRNDDYGISATDGLDGALCATAR
jgi:hypothetical protein